MADTPITPGQAASSDQDTSGNTTPAVPGIPPIPTIPTAPVVPEAKEEPKAEEIKEETPVTASDISFDVPAEKPAEEKIPETTQAPEKKEDNPIDINAALHEVADLSPVAVSEEPQETISHHNFPESDTVIPSGGDLPHATKKIETIPSDQIPKEGMPDFSVSAPTEEKKEEPQAVDTLAAATSETETTPVEELKEESEQEAVQENKSEVSDETKTEEVTSKETVAEEPNAPAPISIKLDEKPEEKMEYSITNDEDPSMDTIPGAMDQLDFSTSTPEEKETTQTKQTPTPKADTPEQPIIPTAPQPTPVADEISEKDALMSTATAPQAPVNMPTPPAPQPTSLTEIPHPDEIPSMLEMASAKPAAPQAPVDMPVPPVPQTTPATMPPTPQPQMVNQPMPTASVDSMLGGLDQHVQEEIQEAEQAPQATPASQQPSLDTMQQMPVTTPESIALNQNAYPHQQHGHAMKKLLMVLGVLVLLAGGTFYAKVMYPVEFNNLIALVTGGESTVQVSTENDSEKDTIIIEETTVDTSETPNIEPVSDIETSIIDDATSIADALEEGDDTFADIAEVLSETAGEDKQEAELDTIADQAISVMKDATKVQNEELKEQANAILLRANNLKREITDGTAELEELDIRISTMQSDLDDLLAQTNAAAE